MVEAEDLELKALKLDLVDLVNDYTNNEQGYVRYMWEYEAELLALVGLPPHTQRKELEILAHKIVASYHKDYNGGRENARY